MSLTVLTLGSLTLTANANLPNEAVNLLAAVIVLEAVGEGAEGMQAVANVAVNRSRVSGKTIPEELDRKFQWRSLDMRTHSSAIADAKKLAGPALWTLAQQISTVAYKGELADLTHGATHFHSILSEPHWAAKLQKTIILKNHVFYR